MKKRKRTTTRSVPRSAKVTPEELGNDRPESPVHRAVASGSMLLKDNRIPCFWTADDLYLVRADDALEELLGPTASEAAEEGLSVFLGSLRGVCWECMLERVATREGEVDCLEVEEYAELISFLAAAFHADALRGRLRRAGAQAAELARALAGTALVGLAMESVEPPSRGRTKAGHPS